MIWGHSEPPESVVSGWWLRRKTHVSDVTNVSIGVVSLMECSQGPLLVVCGRGASHVKNGANGEDFRPKVSFPQRTSGYNLKKWV